MFIPLMLTMLAPFCACTAERPALSVFYKNKPPSQRALAAVKPLLHEYTNVYEISYYDIEDTANAARIAALGLPGTHFPFAVVIKGTFTAALDTRVVSFVHFPTFMKGIGRHEGNWSLDDLQRVLQDPSVLQKENVLPDLDETAEDSQCEE